LSACLTELGVRVVVAGTRDSAADGGLAVIATAGGQPPRGAAGGPALPWVWMPARPPAAAAVSAAVAAGAYDVVPGSAAPGAIATRLAARLAELQAPGLAPPQTAQLVSDSAAGRRLLDELAQAARTSMPVLLTGETGTGKEVTARLLHAWSSRQEKRFVPINCAAIPNDLLESELFGYAKGAFSGAVQSYDGQLSAAEGGSVFLDEVDDTPLSFQVKLLRVLEDRTVCRLGENRSRQVDFRIIAATNRDLRPLIARGLFGADLFERLAIVSIQLPPLRDRAQDLPALTRHMIARFYTEEPAARERHQVVEVTAEASAVLAAHRWPGNIRELRNVIYGALVRKRAGRELLASDLLAPLVRRSGEIGDVVAAGAADAGARRSPIDAPAIEDAVAAGSFNLRAAIEELERVALVAAVTRTAGNASAAAALLGEVGRGGAQDPGATVRAMMRRLGVAPARRRARSGRR
jgi:two-component system response regulator GlrR